MRGGLLLTLVLLTGCGPVGVDGPVEGTGPDAGPGSDAGLLFYEGNPSSTVADELVFRWPEDTTGWRIVELDPVLAGDGVDVGFTVDDQTESVLLLAQTSDNIFLLPLTVEGPDGEVFVTDIPPEDLSDGDVSAAKGFPAQLFSPARALVQRGTLAYLLPNTPDVLFAPGRYRATIGLFQAVGPEPQPVSLPVRVAALFKDKLDDVPRSLRFVVHFSTPQLGAADAPLDPVWSAAEETVRATFGQAGIVLPDFEYLDLDLPEFDTITLEAETCDRGELSGLLAAGAPTARPAMHLFIVEAFSCEVGGFDIGPGIAGIAGGIPAALPLFGTQNSGVAVARSFFEDKPDELGNIVAHEVSHALGLFHTKERSRPTQQDVFDIVSDTDEEEPGVIQNLMYFISNEFTGLSDGQAAVLRAHPLITGP